MALGEVNLSCGSIGLSKRKTYIFRFVELYPHERLWVKFCNYLFGTEHFLDAIRLLSTSRITAGTLLFFRRFCLENFDESRLSSS